MLLKNATFLNSHMRFDKGDIYIDGDRINFQVSDIEIEEIVDCTDYLILPGLFNSHFHSYSPIAKGLMKEMELQDWGNSSNQGKLQQLLFDYVDNKLTENEFSCIAQKSYVDMVKNGVTFVSDSDPQSPGCLKKVMEELGIKGIIDAYEEIGDYQGTPGKIDFGSHLLEEEDITEEELQKVKELKSNYNPIMMTHCLESQWRSDIVQSKYGQSSVSLYRKHGLLDKHTVLFHGVYMNPTDMDILAKSNSSVIHCPSSNLDTGAGIADVSTMIDKGLNVGLGTDYSHTNMWELMRLTYYLMKVNNPLEKHTVEDVFKMATRNGAEAYSLKAITGEIKQDYKADLIFLRKEVEMEPMIDSDGFTNSLYNLLFYSRDDSVQHVMIDGEWVMKERKIMLVDEEALDAEYNRISDGFRKYLDSQDQIN
ncbi:amidohydrolase family protein [Salinicoccus cyprini]|uniref:Amidohydrolase family protein n=1 Tax=Salinicoccus cyprini TaxID=2493691 RepID=A0A558AYQ6_9STAP|nr:amidohydrolase family protein [Salinicoccus cyprini]TVT29399.1 amidohydrolase family protein [Salinicoccus cyprini]